MRIIGIFLVCFSTFISCGKAQTSQTTKLSAKESQTKLEQTPTLQIIDVRTPEEFQNGHIKNAMNLNINGREFEKQSETLDKSKPILVFCLSGGRSKKAVQYFEKNGFQEIYEMPGGMLEWRAENLPEVKKNSTTKGMRLQDFENRITSDKMVLVDFYADWCAPCIKMKPFLEKMASEMPDKMELVRINVDENAELCKTLNVSALPVLKLYKNKEVVWENIGFTEEKKLREQLK